MNRLDRQLVIGTAEESHTDVALAQLATDQADNPRVRDLARRLGRDWTDLAVEAGTLAAATNQPLENDLVGDRVYRGLSELHGRKFDRRFLAAAVERCARQIDQLQTAATRASDPKIRQFADSHLGSLRRDLAEARQVQHALNR